MNQEIELSKSKTSIFEVSENEFTEKIIEDSVNNLVLVDFWAPWCGPCKQLTPTLEEVVKESGGKVVLAKINVDNNQQIAAQLKIQSIPTVIAVYNKKIVNAFQGALPKSKIIEFIEKILDEGLPMNNNKFIKKIDDLCNQSNWAEVKELIENFIAENNADDGDVISYYIKCLTNLNKFDDLKHFLDSLSDEILKNKNVVKEINNYKMLESSANTPSLEILLDKYNKEPNRIKNIISLSEKYFFENQNDEALNLLLVNISKFKKEDKNQIKKQILKFFDALGNNHEITKIYRRKLSSLLFS